MGGVVKLSDDFWNIRGDFKIGGVLNIGTQCSLVRLADGRYVMLDAYTLSGAEKQAVDDATDNGNKLDAIINLHPFHTVHVEAAHGQYPDAKLYGTRRHHALFPDLPWQPELTESEDCAALFAGDLEFSIPAGVDFISSNEHLHFSSVLAYHRASKTIHCDDTLMYLKLPGPLGQLRTPTVKFHLTLPQTLERRPGAAQDFRDWVTALVERWSDAENLCAAHSSVLKADDVDGVPLPEQILTALERVKKTLGKHERRFG